MTRHSRFRETGYPVPRRDTRNIRTVAHELLDWTYRRFSRKGEPVEVIKVIEFLGSEVDNGYPDFEIVEDSEIPGFVAKFYPDRMLFKFACSIWDAASDGDGEARYHIAHEIGHNALKHPSEAFGREFLNDIVVKDEDSEHQANSFADEYLMDSRLIARDCNVAAVMRQFGVDEPTASRRINNLTREKFWSAERN